ncbi:MAG: IS256 family transposase [Deltaproteobacteria bacterium]|nr:IS256 family transposase [Deltaproteobacteria bacterium]
MIRTDLKNKAEDYLSKLMDAELTQFLGREPYERHHGAANHRNGSYNRNYALKGIGNLSVKIPRDRQGQFKTDVIPRSQRYEKEIAEDLSLMFLTGISTRSLSMISKRLTGRKISSSEISNINKEFVDAVEQWRERDLSEEAIKYMFIDGVNFDMRIHGSIQKVPVLVVIGVTEKGCKKVLGFQSGDKESASTWREFFKDLKSRGLNSKTITLGVMDGFPGLEKVFKEEFLSAKVQRCQVHVVRNVLAKVPKKLKEAVADNIRSIYYASSKKKAMEFSYILEFG